MSRSLRFLVIALLFTGLATTAFAQDIVPELDIDGTSVHTAAFKVSEAQRQKVQLLLSGYEYFPTVGELRQVSPHVHVILIEIASDEGSLPGLRLRAVDALGLLPQSDALANFFEDKLVKTNLSTVFANHYINASMKVYREAALPWVSPLLNHVNLQTQLTAVHAIGRFGGFDGRQLLNFHAQFARDALLHENIERALSR